MSSVRQRWVLVVLAVALVATVMFVGLASPDDASDQSSPAAPAPSTPAPSATTTGAPTEVTPDEFCERFLMFVDANSAVTSSPDTESGQTLLEIARTMLEMPNPIGMSPGARVSLDMLVEGTLAQLEDVPGVTVDAAPDPANAGEPNPAEFDAYLEATCPA